MGAMCGKEMPVVETANPPGAPSATSSTTEVGQIDLDVSGSQGMETEGFRAWSEMENGTERDFLVEEAGDDAAMKYLERQYSDQHHAMERNYNNPAFWYKQMQDAPMDADGFQLTAPFTLKKASDLARYLRRPDARPIPQRCVYEVLIAACKQAEGQKGSLQRLTPPGSADERLYVCGDTHGQLQDVLWIFELHGEPKPGNHYLFNGDMADRGRNGIEIFMLLLAFKLACPEAVFMNRGNHEQRDLNERPFAQGGGFAWECRAKYPHDENLIELFQRYFCLMPVAATIGSWAFVIHGGLPRVKDVGLDDFDTINRIRQPPLKLESRDDHLLFDSLWADPHEGDGVIEGSARGGFSIQFGMDVTKEFCRR